MSSFPGFCASLAFYPTTREVNIYLGTYLELDRTTGRPDQPWSALKSKVFDTIMSSFPFISLSWIL